MLFQTWSFSKNKRRSRRTLAAWLLLFVGGVWLLHHSNYVTLWDFESTSPRRWDSGGLDGYEPRTGKINGSVSDMHSLVQEDDITRQHREDMCPGMRFREEEREEESWDASTVVNGLPTERFRDNLRNDTHYITTWANAGFTNQFIGYVNMIYLAMLSNRVPIMPPFAPDHHIPFSAGIIPFGDLFDLDHLRAVLRMPVLEWRDVKALAHASDPNPYPYAPSYSSSHNDEDEDEEGLPLVPESLGCWSTRKPSEGEPIRAENVVNHLGLDVSYTRVPPVTRHYSSNPDEHVLFSPLAALVYPQTPLGPPDAFGHMYMAPAPRGHAGPPEEALACFDTLYYAGSGVEVYEWRFGWSPVWREVGRHVKFSEEMRKIGSEYLRGVFGVAEEMALPTFIAVHVRRGDFNSFCSQGGDENCYPPLSAYQEQVENVKTDLLDKKGLVVEDVLVMSDETSPTFWDEAASFGWQNINHTEYQTVEQYGYWYPPLIDIVVQSYASGFVGTEDSTFSLISQRRVQDWNSGFVRSVSVRNGM